MSSTISAVLLGYAGLCALLPRLFPAMSQIYKRWGVAFLVLAILVFFAGHASAQMVLRPGHAMVLCESRGFLSGGSSVCTYNAKENRIEVTHKDDSTWSTFWGSGDGPSILSHLCRDTQAQYVIEAVLEPHPRTRRIPCDTGKSESWKIHTPQIKQLSMCEEVEARSLGQIACSFDEEEFVLEYQYSSTVTLVRWSGQYDELVEYLCEGASRVREEIPNEGVQTTECPAIMLAGSD